ncbi:MAG: polysaccharide deacetylase family protein [Bacillota bacterium]
MRTLSIVAVFVLLLSAPACELDLDQSKLPAPRVAAGVMLGLLPVGGLDRPALDPILAKLAQDLARAPIDAVRERVGEGVVPDLNGIALDVAATQEALLKARPGTKLEPALLQVRAAVTRSSFGPRPIYRGNPARKAVTLLINVAWGNEYLPGLLELLREENVKATFFLDGYWVARFPDLARAIRDHGHELGNHAYNHPIMTKQQPDARRESIRRTSEQIHKATGVTETWFTPPAGDVNLDVVAAAHELGLGTVLWTQSPRSLDTVDWSLPGVDKMVAKITANAVPGGMILCHPTQQTAPALARIIPRLRGQGYRFLTVAKLLSPERTLDDD